MASSVRKTTDSNIQDIDKELQYNTMLCSNSDEHEEGVGILMTKAVMKSVIEWHPVSERLLIATFRTLIRNISIIQCYVPTEGGYEEQKEKLYS
jgi:exonuclease III